MENLKKILEKMFHELYILQQDQVHNIINKYRPMVDAALAERRKSKKS